MTHETQDSGRFSIFLAITKESRLLLNTIHSQMILSIILGMEQNLKSPIVTCRVILLIEIKHTGMTYSMLHKYLTWIMRLGDVMMTTMKAMHTHT